MDRDPKTSRLHPTIKLDQVVVVGRNGDFRKVFATLWQKGSIGFAGTQVIERAILEEVESLGESFANKCLSRRDKETKKETIK